jgi:PAS domain S-box-containing protein
MEEKQHLDISEEELKELINSFSTFNQVTQKLRSAYQELEERFGDLNLKLEQTNLDLRQSLAEKDKISGYLNIILESLTSGVLAVDLDGNVTLFNRAAEKILGYRTEEVIGKPYHQVMGMGVEERLTLPFVLKSLKSQLSEEGSCRNEEKVVCSKKGDKIPVGFSISLLRDKDGEALGAVEVFFDLTKLKQMEEEMMKVKTLAALGEMAAVVAHEVKNPLGGIRGFADLLDRDLERGDPRRKSVKKIMEGVETLDRIVMGLLDYTKPIQLSLHKVEMVKFMDEVINFFEMDASQAKTNIRIFKNYPKERLFCHVDTEQFRQVVLNLLHNAVQSMPAGGKIAVELNPMVETADLSPKSKDKMALLKISDTGTGMGKGTIEKLFTPFFTTKEHGTGLGLSIVRKIVEAHQGEVEVESELGKGTAVRIRLPMVL